MSEALPQYAHLKARVVSSRLTGKSKHDGMIRGFFHMKESWYGNANLKDRRDNLVDEVTIGFYGPGGDKGTTGEFSVRWKELSLKLVPQLCVFDDAWEALTHFSDLLAEMAELNNTNPSPEEFCAVLKWLGIKDLTPRENPRGDN